MGISLLSSRKKVYCGLVWVVILISLILPIDSVLAAPVEPAPVDLTQPDGTTFRALPFGDEWYNGVEYLGYTILKEQRE